MNRMAIHDQKDLFPMLTTHTTQKLVEEVGIEHLSKYHEMKLPLIAECRDHVAFESLSRNRDDRCLSLTSICATNRMIGTQTRLISPKYPRPLFPCLHMNGRIFFFQPFFHRLGILLIGFANWLLGSQIPCLQVSTHCPNGQRYAKFSFDQIRDSPSCPQIKRHFQLIRTAIRDHLYRLGRLPGQELLASFSSAASLGFKGLFSSFLIVVDPVCHRLARDSKYFGNFCFAAPTKIGLYRFAANIFLGLRWKFSGIFDLHARYIT